MNPYEKIQELSKEKGISVRELEKRLGFSNGYFSKWKTVSPNSEGLQKVADYFSVSVDYLLGRTDQKYYYDLTEKDEKYIQKRLEEMIEDLSNGGALAFSKDESEIDQETRELLIASLENSLRIAKIEAKKRFTPKKYRK